MTDWLWLALTLSSSPSYKWAKLLTLNIFSKVPRGQIK